MKDRACARMWEAAAVEDGRLDKLARASFERHVAVCEACARETRFLAGLRSLGNASCPVSNDMDRRRLRAKVLKAANDLVVRPRRLPQRSWPIVLVAACAAIGIMFLLRGHRGQPIALHLARPSIALLSPTYEVSPIAGANVNVVSAGVETRLALSSGALLVHVQKLRPGQRFVIALPDGELEVKGTKFIVETTEARTDRVRVLEGSVALRIGASGERLVAAGTEWVRPEEAPRLASNVVLASLPTPRPPVAKALPVASSDAPDDVFARAMKAWSAGAYARSEQLFAEFQQGHGGDSRVEDAMFLRSLCRARQGDKSGASSIAHEYLARYPNGLRRDAAERLSHTP